MSQIGTRVSRLFILRVGALLIPFLLIASSAEAGSRQTKEREARKACLSGDPVKGVELLAELFVETRNATYLFNQGRCFEQNRRYEDAAARFEEYLRTPDLKLTPEERASAEKHIAICSEKLEKQRLESSLQPVVPAAPAPASAPAPLPPTPAPMPEAPAASVTTVPTPAPAGERNWALVTAGIITGVVGVGGIVTGVIFNLKANQDVDDMQTKLGAYSKAKTDERKNYERLAWIGYGAGAACVVTGAILVGLGASRSHPSSSSDVAFVPSFGVGQVGVALTGGF